MEIRFRNIKDDQFNFKLFSRHKVKELNAENWPAEMRLQLCKMQFEAFEKNIIEKYPNFKDHIISIESFSIGRIIFNKTKDEITLIYLALLPKYQNKGIGRKILYCFIDESNRSKKKLLLKVAKENPAFHLYKTLGFIAIDEDNFRYSMIYLPLSKT